MDYGIPLGHVINASDAPDAEWLLKKVRRARPKRAAYRQISLHTVCRGYISAIRNTIGAAFAAADEMRTKHAAGADWARARSLCIRRRTHRGGQSQTAKGCAFVRELRAFTQYSRSRGQPASRLLVCFPRRFGLLRLAARAAPANVTSDTRETLPVLPGYYLCSALWNFSLKILMMTTDRNKKFKLFDRRSMHDNIKSKHTWLVFFTTSFLFTFTSLKHLKISIAFDSPCANYRYLTYCY